MNNAREDIEALVRGLSDKDNTKACGCAGILSDISAESPAVYPYLDQFCSMLADTNSYMRNRGMALIAANAAWDEEDRLSDMLDSILTHIQDERPITSRQCIKALVVISQHKPALRNRISAALRAADATGYGDSMAPLIEKDIQKAVVAIGNMQDQ